MKDAKKKNELLILVDEKDRPLGFAKRGKAHLGKGLRHRAFNVAVFNSRGQLLLAKRHPQKLFGGLWDGTVSSHPLKGESYEASIVREVEEEIGVVPKSLQRVGELVYQSGDGDGMAENEFCALFKLTTDEEVKPHPREVSRVKWVGWAELVKDVEGRPKDYAPWLLLSLPKIAPE